MNKSFETMHELVQADGEPFVFLPLKLNIKITHKQTIQRNKNIVLFKLCTQLIHSY